MKQKVKLKDIASYSKGSQINGTELIENGEFDYLNGGINPSGKWNEANCNADTIAISEGGNSCGYVNYMRKPFWCGAHCYYLYDTVANTKYLYYALKSQQERIMKLRSGACMPNIKKSDLGNFEFIFDDDDKQQKNTTDILNKIERVIELRQKEIFYLDELVKARFVEMFGGCTNRIFINDICSIITDGTHQSPKFHNTGIPFILVSNLSNNVITYNTEKFINEETYNELIKRTPIEIGDVLLSTVGSYGHPAIVTENKKFLFQRHIAYMKPKHDLVNSVYLHSALLSSDIQQQIEDKVKGIAQKTLNLSEIRKIVLPLPSIDEQNQFADFVQQVDKSKSAIKKSLEETQILFDSLMQKYFS